jgi:tryptophan-rich sensory protein
MLKPNYFIIPAIAVLVSVAGSWLTSQGIDSGWYDSLVKPEWTPDGSVIGAVWTIIYILTTACALFVWNRFPVGRRRSLVIGVFLLNALLNVGWTYVFFTKHLLGWAIIEALVLNVSVLVLMSLIHPRSKLAWTLLLPYATWVFFAAYLNYNIWTLNS